MDPYLREYHDNAFSIGKRIELGKLAEMFLGPVGKFLFYFVLVIYLYGDLAIYAVSVPTSLIQVTGPLNIGSLHLNFDQTYYVYVGIFAMVVVPLSFFNFQKTKLLQVATLATRNFALLL